MSTERVTLRDIYEIVNRLEEKMDDKIALIDDRVGAIESFQNKILGIGAVLSAILGMGGAWFWTKLTGGKV